MKLKIFYSNEKINNHFILSGQEMVHSFKVYRLKIGDYINIICGDDQIYTCQIDEISTKIKAKILKIEANKANPKTRLTVFQCNLKADKMEYLVQKLTEIGVEKFIPVISENIVKTDLNIDRLENIAKQSAKQCGTSRGIKISPLVSFNEMISQFQNFDKVFVAHEREDKVTINSAMSNITGQNCAILIGPEGGISESEIEDIKQFGGIIFGLGNRILRAETACVAISTVALLRLGEFEL